MFDKSAQCYDLIYSDKDYSKEASFIHDVIQGQNCPARSILDLGCGTGKHAIALSELFNYQVTGLDINQEMIEIARRKASAVRFQQGDMTNFALEDRYDAVISMFSAIGWLKSIDRVSQAFACASSHLKDDGIIIVEPWFSPEEFNDGYVFMDVSENADTKVCRMSRTKKVDNLSIINFHYMKGSVDKIETYSEIHEIGLFTHEEILHRLALAGISAEYKKFPDTFNERGLFIGRKTAPYSKPII